MPSNIVIKVEPVANTYGKGTASLPVTVDVVSGTPVAQSARAYWTYNGIRQYQELTFSASTPSDIFNFTLHVETGTSSPMQMSSGSHTVQFYFSDLEDPTSENFMQHVLCYFSEVINIYDGFETNKWVDSSGSTAANSLYFETTTTGGVTTTNVKITNNYIEYFEKTNFFVSADGSDDIADEVRGTAIKPYATIQKAVSAIQAINEPGFYTINLMSNIVSEEAVEIYPVNGNLYVTIQSYNYENAPYYIDFDGNEGFDPQIDSLNSNNKAYLILNDIEIKNVASDETTGYGISKRMTQTFFGGYIIIQDNFITGSTTQKCNARLGGTSTNPEKIQISGSDPLDSRSRIGVYLNTELTSTPRPITNGYKASYSSAAPLPSLIFTSDQDYAAGWNEGTDEDSWHTEAVLALTSGNLLPIGLGQSPFDIVFPENPWVCTKSGATENTGINIKFYYNDFSDTANYNGKELDSTTVTNLKEYQVTVLKGIVKYPANAAVDAEVLLEKTSSNVDYVVNGTNTGITISRETLNSAGITDGVYTVNVRAVYNGADYSSSVVYYVGQGKPFAYWLEEKNKLVGQISTITDDDKERFIPEANQEFSIATKEELKIFRDMINGVWKPDGYTVVSSPNFSTLTVYLISDIDLEKEDWTSIGSGNTVQFDDEDFILSFNGTFEGNNHTIKGLRLPVGQTGDETQRYYGLFGYCKGKLSNLNVEGITTQLASGTETIKNCKSQFVGGIVAYMAKPDDGTTGMGVITNCSYNGSLKFNSLIETVNLFDSTKNVCIGGIAGYVYEINATDAKITNCTNNAEIVIKTQRSDDSTTYAKVNIGGICGYSGCKISNCKNYGKINKQKLSSTNEYLYPLCYVGGIVAVNTKNAAISDCVNYGNISQGGSASDELCCNAYLGGIVCIANGNVTDCTNYGNVSTVYTKSYSNGCGAYTGGIIAKIETNTASISNAAVTVSRCKNYGEITNKYNGAGGIVASVTSTNASIIHAIENCQNYGKIGFGSKTTNGSNSFMAGFAGGIAGTVDCTVVKNCTNNGVIDFVSDDNVNISIYSGIGGIIGSVGSDTKGIVSCENNGSVSGMVNVGGIAGLSSIENPENDGNISYVYAYINCKNTGTVKGQGNRSTVPSGSAGASFTKDYSCAGGIIGKINDGSYNLICNCLNTGNVSGEGSFYKVGGVIGSSTLAKQKIINCVNAAAVSYNNTVYSSDDYQKYYFAGLLCDGFASNNNSIIENCFYASERFPKSGDSASTGWCYNSSDTIVDVSDIYTSIDVLFPNTKIEDSALKYEYVTAMYEPEEPEKEEVIGCLNKYVSDNPTVEINSVNYNLKNWCYNSRNEIDFINDESTPVIGGRTSSFAYCKTGSFKRTTSNVSITVSSFYMCVHEVTQEEYVEIIGTNPSYFNGSTVALSPAENETQEKRPVEQVSWYQAIVYCNKRSVAAGLNPCYALGGSTDTDTWGEVPITNNTTWNGITCDWNANGFRLPTEAEWEFAARGGVKSLMNTTSAESDYTYSGSNSIDEVAWYKGSSETGNSDNKTHQVMKKAPNELGIYDMSGNVYEWCWDGFNAYHDDTIVIDPTGNPAETSRHRRGGSFYNTSGAMNCKPIVISGFAQESSDKYTGIRVVRKAGK